jgi:general transcription factor 3C polypeptide 5 (transcription factor C subunit 1)
MHTVPKMREFRFEEGIETGAGQNIIPPPHSTDKIVPFNYFYEQNPYIKAEGVDESGNPLLSNIATKPSFNVGHYIPHDQYPVPDRPYQNAQLAEQVPQDLMETVRQRMDARPIWTRRALLNTMRKSLIAGSMATKFAIYSSGYQFKGGPWRDGVLKYGMDPRTDPKYRVFQCLAFKLHQLPKDQIVRDGALESMTPEAARNSHYWDGETFCTDGKFWQICDITDPFLRRLIDEAPLRDECDITESGWYHSGTWSKIKAYMRAKMVAIRAGRLGKETDMPKKAGYIYASVLVEKLRQWPDIFPPNTRSSVNVAHLLYGLEDVEGLEGLRYRNRSSNAYGDVRTQLGLTPMGRTPKAPRPKRQLLLANWLGRDGGNGDGEGEEEEDEGASRDVSETPGIEGRGDAGGAWGQMLDSDVGSDGDGDDDDQDSDGAREKK